MLLSELFATKYAPYRLRGRSPNTFRLYDLTIMQFGRSLGRAPTTDDLTDDNLLMHLARRSSVAPATRNKELSQLCALWRFAAQRDLVKGWPTVPEEPEPERVPIAWTQSEVRQLLRACQTFEGYFGSLPRSKWFAALIRLGLDTGERIEALRSVQWSGISDGWVTFPAEVTKSKSRDRRLPISDETIDAIEALRRYSDTPEVFHFPYAKNYLWKLWRDLLNHAGLPTGRKYGLHCLRKTFASVADAAGLDATKLLDHSDKRVTRAYLDPRMATTPNPTEVMAAFLRNPPQAEKRKSG